MRRQLQGMTHVLDVGHRKCAWGFRIFVSHFNALWFIHEKAGKLPTSLDARKRLIFLFPLDLGGRLAADVIDYARNTTQLFDYSF
jgi:hypothetical protein